MALKRNKYKYENVNHTPSDNMEVDHLVLIWYLNDTHVCPLESANDIYNELRKKMTIRRAFMKNQLTQVDVIAMC